MSQTLTPADLFLAEQNMEDPRKKEAARRIIEMSGELNLTLEDLADLPSFVRYWATLKWRED